MDQRILFPKRDLSPHYSASDSEEKEFSDDDDDRNHKHRRRETQPHSQERNLEEGSIQPYRNRNKPFENGHPHREATSQSNEAWRNYNMPPLEKHFPENFDKRRHGSTAVSRAPLDLNQRVRGNQSWTGDPGSGRGRGRELGPWSIHDSRFNSLDFNPAIVQQGYVPSSLFAGRGMPTVSNSQSASWNAFGLVQGLPNGGLDSLHSIGLQRTLRPSSMNMGIPHQRCRDFEERGFCLRGDMCPMEHGINRIVVEDVQSLSQFNLPVSIPSAHLMGASAVPGPLSAVSAPNTSGNGQGVYNKSSKAGAEDVGLDLNGAADGSAVASGADFYDPDQPLWTSDCARTSSTILTPDPTKANRGDNQAGLPHDAEMGLYSGLDDERPIKYTGDALGSHNTNLPVRGQIGASENRINSGHIGSVTYEDQLLDTAKDAVGHHGKISKADDIVSHATDLSMKTLNNSAHFVQKPSQKAQCTLFVSGVPHIDNKRDALLSHFQKFGEVINIYIPSNSERAFVQFSKREEAEDALKAPDAVMGNRFIKLWWANRDNIPLDKVNSTIASRVVAAASVPYNPDAAIKEKDISKGSSFHDSISAGISSDRPKSVLTNGPPPPVQKKVENLDYLKEIRKKQEMLDKKRNEFKQALEKLEKQKQATGIKAELTAEQTAKRQKTKTVTDIHTAGSPSSIGSSCIVSSTQAELTDRSRSEGNAKPHKSNTSTMVALTESSSFKPSPHQQAPAAQPFVVNRFKLDNRPTSFKIASPLPTGLANVSALKEHFSSFGELSNVDLEDIKVEDNAAESAGSNKRACIYFTTRLSQGCILGASTLDNIEEWKWKLSKLERNKDEQEVVSRERKDRRDFQQISALAVRMGLYSQQYSKVVVISKVPLPYYRSDLDDRRPQREVVLPYGLEDQLVAYLKKYIGGKSMNKDFVLDNSISRSSHEGNLATNQGIYRQEEPITRTSHVAEKILHRRSLEILNKQQSWQNSLEGQKMLEFRKSLPAYKEKDSLLRQIAQNQVVVVSGETGCGKTTQLPQYILESEVEAARGAACSIICTQPRRISAMSVAERVAAERGEKLGESVGFKVRLEGMKGRDTRLLFCTTGILLRRLLVDRMLKGVTHVIVDEIHERGMNEDFLLIVLKELLPRRPELRLILMSATLNADLFSSYFGSAPMIHIPGFTYPVRSHFLENILEMTGYRLTTYNQIDNYGQDKMWKMQKQTLKRKKTQIASTVEDTLEAFDLKEYSLRTRDSLSCWNPDSIGFNLIEHVLCYICRKERPGAVLVFMTGWDDINSLKSQLQAHPLLGDPSKVLLLGCHGSMDSSEQRLIFNRPEEGIRKIVLATNMAETSITINDVVFVVDCGKAKETSYDALNNTPCLLPSWISKASARQRRGRAGRVQPGECFHLYPRCVHDAFADYQLPELLRTPLQSLCLQIKSLQLGSISDFLSRALQPPEPLSVQNAIEYLKTIGALDEYENLTVLGQKLSMLPVEPKLGKMLILGAIFNCLNPIMTLVAGLSVRDPFLMPFDRRDLAEAAKAQFSSRDFSDHLALIRAYDGWKDAEKRQAGYDYCWNNFLSAQTLRAIDSLRKQFLYLLKDTGLVDNIDKCNSWSHDEHLIRAITCAGLFPGICSVVNKGKSISLKTMEDGPVLLHSNSVNAQQPRLPYPWLVFNEKIKVNSVMLRDSTAVCDSMVLLFGGSISRGGLDGHLKMLGGYLEFFMKPGLAETYLRLRKELEELIQMKLLNPKLDINDHNELLSAVRLVVADDRGDGKFVYGRQLPAPSKKKVKEESKGSLSMGGTDNSKNHLQTLLNRAGHESPTYKTKQLKNNNFRSVVMFNGLNFDGQPCTSKKQAEKDAASEALQWLIGDNQPSHKVVDHMSTILKKSKRKPEVHASKWR